MDSKRLNKQIVEGNQILSASLIGSKWHHHPAVLQWKGYEKGLGMYVLACITEAIKRSFKTDKSHLRLNQLLVDYPVFETGLTPPWLGYEPFHSSHRSRLLFKGRVDSVCGQLKKFLGVRSINAWLKSNNYPLKNYFKHPDIERLEEFCQKQFDLKANNYYSQFSWPENDKQEYFWPIKFNKL